MLKQLYSLRSANYPYPLAGSVTIPMLSLCAAGEFMVYDSVVEGFEKARQFFGVELEEIPTYWPTSDGQTYYVPEEGIFVSKDDRGDRDVIMHEYGHFLADSRGFGLGSVGQDPIHYWNLDPRIRPTNRTEKEARNLAFREAWAMLFSIATLFGDSGYPYVGDSKYQDVDEITRKAIVVDLEGDTSGDKAPGEYYEHMNCCALWDIFDDNCDASDNEDTLSDPKLARIWAIADDSSPSDIRDFWNAWFARFGDLKQFNRIIWDHGMTFKAPVPTPTMEDFETGDFRAFAWIPGNPSWVVVPVPAASSPMRRGPPTSATTRAARWRSRWRPTEAGSTSGSRLPASSHGTPCASLSMEPRRANGRAKPIGNRLHSLWRAENTPSRGLLSGTPAAPAGPTPSGSTTSNSPYGEPGLARETSAKWIDARRGQ